MRRPIPPHISQVLCLHPVRLFDDMVRCRVCVCQLFTGFPSGLHQDVTLQCGVNFGCTQISGTARIEMLQGPILPVFSCSAICCNDICDQTTFRVCDSLCSCCNMRLAIVNKSCHESTYSARVEMVEGPILTDFS